MGRAQFALTRKEYREIRSKDYGAMNRFCTNLYIQGYGDGRKDLAEEYRLTTKTDGFINRERTIKEDESVVVIGEDELVKVLSSTPGISAIKAKAIMNVILNTKEKPE